MCINAKTRPKDNTHELNMRYDIPPSNKHGHIYLPCSLYVKVLTGIMPRLKTPSITTAGNTQCCDQRQTVSYITRVIMTTVVHLPQVSSNCNYYTVYSNKKQARSLTTKLCRLSQNLVTRQSIDTQAQCTSSQAGNGKEILVIFKLYKIFSNTLKCLKRLFSFFFFASESQIKI